MATITLGSEVQVENVNATGNRAQAKLDANRTIALYVNSDLTDKVRACVLDIAAEVITPGTPATADSTSNNYDHIDVATLSSTKAIAVYQELVATPNSDILGCVLDISGATVTPGTPGNIETQNCRNELSVCGLSSTVAVCAYYNFTDDEVQARVLTVSGSTFTPGSDAAVVSGTWRDISIAALSSSKAVVVGVDTGTNQLRGCVLDVSGSTITPGTAVNIASASNVGSAMQKVVIPISSTVAVAAYGSTDSKLIAMSISGTTITPGSGIQIDVSLRPTSIAAISSTKVMAAISNGSTTSKVITASLSGTTLTSDNNAETLASNYVSPALADYDTNKGVVLYADAGVADFEALTATLPAPVAKFYQATGSLTEKFDLSFSGLETPGAMAVRDDAKVALGGKEAGGSSEIVTTVVSPYTSETDITDSLTGVPIDSLEWINRND